jgi:hypothetical protein
MPHLPAEDGLVGLIHLELQQNPQDAIQHIPHETSFRRIRTQLVRRLRQRAQVSNNCLRIGLIHVVDVHRRPQRFALRPCSFLEDSFSLLLRKAWETRERGSAVRPIGDRLHWHDPDWRALEPGMAIQFALRVPRRVAFGAFCNLFGQVPPTFDLACFRRSCARACATH